MRRAPLTLVEMTVPGVISADKAGLQESEWWRLHGFQSVWHLAACGKSRTDTRPHHCPSPDQKISRTDAQGGGSALAFAD